MGAQRRRPYTQEDDDFIDQHFGEWSNRQIADVLERTESGVRYRAKKLGLTRVTYEPPKVSEAAQNEPDRHKRLVRLRELMEADILGDLVPMMQRPSYYREYRALLAEIAELEGGADESSEAVPQSTFAQALAQLAEQQRNLLEQAAST